MKQWKRMQIACVLVVLLAALAPSMVGATSRQAVPCSGWTIVPSPNPTNYLNILNGVAAVSPTDAWAVGYDFVSNGPSQTVIEHWNGMSWQVVSSPNGGNSDLFGITALSTSDVWAVGYAEGSMRTLIEHWDGSQWRIIPSPNGGSYLNSLGGVFALTSNDIWTVGASSTSSNSPLRTLIEHWDGSQWRIVSSPNVGSYNNDLYSVTAISPTNVWAVGGYNSAQRPIVVRSLVEHWDGTKWRLVHVPGPNYSGLGGVTAVQANDLWAVGGKGGATLTEHWNGQHWQVVKSPNPQGPSGLLGVAADSASDIWAVYRYNSSESINQTLTEHWNGTQWQIEPSPNQEEAANPTFDNYLSGVANVPASHAFWAVGYYQPHDGYTGKTLIEYYC